jgi:hypothetical protein
MPDALDPTFPSFVGGRSYAFWRRVAQVREAPEHVPAPAVEAPREEPATLAAATESLPVAPG